MTPTTKVSILLFDGLTALDAVGPYDVLRQVPGWEVTFVGKVPGQVRTEDGGLGLVADVGLGEAPDADILLVPGGSGIEALSADAEVLDWVRATDRETRWTTSVCTGSLVLGAAGLLEGRRATTYWQSIEELREFGAEPVSSRWVEDGKYLTAAGVSAGIDMALHLIAEEVAPEMSQAVQLGIEYDPSPPFDTGSPAKAPTAIVEAVRAASA
ncbi:MAG TPA: DJ-1/PfpI family protein [Solirubrobacterales bacterium]|jgi:transcriptional regulator GlxA family with amidase domain|nr:DJ-1/PfpI family protein [Solirubrobacterales bacterium]